MKWVDIVAGPRGVFGSEDEPEDAWTVWLNRYDAAVPSSVGDLETRTHFVPVIETLESSVHALDWLIDC